MFEYVKAMVNSTLGAFFHASLWVSSTFQEQRLPNEGYDRCAHPNPITIVFIHGTGDQACGGKNFADALLSAGLPERIQGIHLLAFEKRYQGLSIEAFAQQLNQCMKQNGYRDVIYIGHSRGGLVAAKSAQILSEDPESGINVRQVYCVAAPFQGSYLACESFAFFSTSVGQMSPNSGFLAQLNSDISEHPACEYRFIVGKHDWIVPQGGVVAGYFTKHPDSVYYISGHGHLSILGSKRLMAYIQQCLQQCCVNRDSDKAAGNSAVDSRFSIVS